ncbi:MAG: hypothetical protein ACXAE3_05895 [Candidatus Kariarchaeaceae archaeon]|jgi:hypothetical protein
MTLPETKMSTTLAYREAILLALAISESRGNRRIRFLEELSKFYHLFSDYLSFPEKNLDHYGLMLRKLFNSQSIYYEHNRPVLTIKGSQLVDQIISMQSDAFKRKWIAYIEFIE